MRWETAYIKGAAKELWYVNVSVPRFVKLKVSL